MEYKVVWWLNGRSHELLVQTLDDAKAAVVDLIPAWGGRPGCVIRCDTPNDALVMDYAQTRAYLDDHNAKQKAIHP